MAKVFLHKWGAIELFCRILIKAEKAIEREKSNKSDNHIRPTIDYAKNEMSEDEIQIQLKNFTNEVINKKLDDCSTHHYSDDIGIKIFGERPIPEKKRQYSSPKRSLHEQERLFESTRPKAFYELGFQIRNNDTVILEESLFNAFLNYIERPGLSPLLKINIHPFDKYSKQRDFEGTSYWVYRYDEFNGKRGVSRSCLKLLSFGQAQFDSIYPEYELKEPFTGHYKIYEDSSSFLIVYLRGHKDRQFHTRIIVYIGQDKVPSFALGHIDNFGDDAMYSGSLILDKITEENANKTNQDFLTKEHNMSDVPPYVWEYFKSPENNVIHVPALYDALGVFTRKHLKLKEHKNSGD